MSVVRVVEGIVDRRIVLADDFGQRVGETLPQPHDRPAAPVRVRPAEVVESFREDILSAVHSEHAGFFTDDEEPIPQRPAEQDVCIDEDDMHLSERSAGLGLTQFVTQPAQLIERRSALRGTLLAQTDDITRGQTGVRADLAADDCSIIDEFHQRGP
jgi:hypothetical protein